jgi:hypothetical protein
LSEVSAFEKGYFWGLDHVHEEHLFVLGLLFLSEGFKLAVGELLGGEVADFVEEVVSGLIWAEFVVDSFDGLGQQTD